jgi:hypothetical protein
MAQRRRAVFLHYVLDQWFDQEVRPRLKGEAFLIRYADDCAPRRCKRMTSGVSLNTMLRER